MDERSALSHWGSSARAGEKVAHESPRAAVQDVGSGLETDEARAIAEEHRIEKELTRMRRLVSVMGRYDERKIDHELSAHAKDTEGNHHRAVARIIEHQKRQADQFTLSFQKFDTAISDAIKGIDKSLSLQIGLATNLVEHATRAIESGHAYFPRKQVAESVKAIRNELDSLKKKLSKDKRGSRRISRQAKRGTHVTRSARDGVGLFIRKMRIRHDIGDIRGLEHSEYYQLVRALSHELESHRIRSDFFVLLHHYIKDFDRIDDELAAYLRDLKTLFGYGANLLEDAEKALIPTLEIFRNEPELRHSGIFEEFDRLRAERKELVREERFEARSDASLIRQINECKAALPGLVNAVQHVRSAAGSEQRRAQGSSVQAEKLERRIR